MAIKVAGLTKSYGDFSINLDFSVEDGETLVLAGPSGCGKTTALNLIAGFAREEGGTILIDGKPVNHLPPWKRRMAVVFQDLALFPHLDVEKNIAYGPFIQGIAPEERRRITGEVLRIVRLGGYGKRPIETLSGGERQRTAIARALAVDPKVLLLDEPFSSLDAPLRRDLRREFLDIRAKSRQPCVFVTHDREEAAVLGDRIALMAAGRIVETGSAREIFHSPKTEFGARFLGTGTVLPCKIEREEARGTRVRSSLGELLIPPGSACDPAGPRIFIPHDALSLYGDSPAAFTALFLRGVFEGDRITLELELPDGTGLTVKTGPRLEFPDQKSPMKWYVNQDLLRFVT
ncbi:MAG: ABC transporter ATP-binding protein [Treponema sp.]|jgi:ABC-type Fe3+/spermidine/putrescine transport system ATPase subunit|nr:ABC transporter ATP-binding protein [Treponema sp.]